MAKKYILRVEKEIEWEVHTSDEEQFSTTMKFLDLGIDEESVEFWKSRFDYIERIEPREVDGYVSDDPVYDLTSKKPFEHLSTTIDGLLDYILKNRERFGF